MPPLDNIKQLANALNVDTAYLLGEIDCERIESQKIHELTGLSKDAAETLCSLSESEFEIINNLILHPSFKDWLFSAYEFTHSHNIQSSTTNAGIMFDTPTAETHSFTKNALKYKVTDTLGNMIEDIYKKNKQEENEKLALKCFTELIYLIDDAITNDFIYFDEETEKFQTQSV